MDEDEDEDEAKQVAPTKSQKKLNKKLKVQDGGAVPVGAPSTVKKEESAPDPSKKGSKEKKKEHKKEKKEKKKEEKQEKKETNDAPTASANTDSQSNKKTLAGGLVIEDAKVGSGKIAKAGSICAMRYIGKLTDGTIFDSNTKGKAVSVQTDKRDESMVFIVFAVHV
jgi:FK506-binding nuclear protein